MNIGKNIDQQILNGKRKTVHLGKDECAMVGFGKKPEQGGFGQIISGRMKNGKRIMVAARKIVDRTCECPALCTAFSLDQNRKIKSARCLACAIRFWTESAWDREREKVREEAKKCFLPFFRLSIPTFPWICHREETQEKQVLYPEKP